MELGLCTNCNQIKTYRKYDNKPLCIICEIKKKYKKSIKQVMVNHIESIPNSDLEKVVEIQ